MRSLQLDGWDFADKFGIGADLLSDEDHQVMRSYGAWVDASLGDKPTDA
ncbi:MAG: hypothetical protein V1875_09040 [Candidatus Altiarchaeota archaeon]